MGQKSTRIHSCLPQVNIFSVFTLDFYRPCLGWPDISVLTSQPIFIIFLIGLQMMTKIKWEIWIWCQYYHRTINCKIFEYFNVSSTNYQWHWIPIINPSCCKERLYSPTPYVKNYSFSHNSKTSQEKRYQKNIFLHLCAKLWLKIQNTYMDVYFYWISLTSTKLVFNGSTNGPEARLLKIQNRSCRAL